LDLISSLGNLKRPDNILTNSYFQLYILLDGTDPIVVAAFKPFNPPEKLNPMVNIPRRTPHTIVSRVEAFAFPVGTCACTILNCTGSQYGRNTEDK